MESEHAEECSSSESGWTMYLASPTEDDDYRVAADEVSGDLGVVDDGEKKGVGDSNGCEGDSDDSMASDASTGPALHQDSSYRKCKDVDIIMDDKKYHHDVGCEVDEGSSQFGSYLIKKPEKEAKKGVERKGGHGSCFKSCFKVRKSSNNWNEK